MAEPKKISLESFIHYLHESNQRQTPERISIFETISRINGLFSIEELHQRMIRETFPVSLATLYNTIELLLNAGMLKCVRLAERNEALYRMNLRSTLQVYQICEECGTIKESNTRQIQRYFSKYDFNTFLPKSFDIYIYGLCRKCQKNKLKLQ